MSNIKGHLFIEVLNYLTQHYGGDGVQKVLDSLDDEDKTVLSKKIITLSWLSAKTFNNLLEQAVMVLAGGDYYLAHELGRYQAEKGISAFYQVFIKMGNPSFVIKRASQLWKTLHDEGELEVQMTGEKSATVKILGYKDASKAQCRSFMGYCEKVLEMSGAKKAEIFETKCATKGAMCCEFVGNWE
ncbi:MAG: hypothetical protein ABH868_04350 [bacterium]